MFQDSHTRKIALVVGVMATLALFAYTYSTLKGARYMYNGPLTISVVGTGEVNAVPDLAVISYTLEAKDKDAILAQNKVAETEKSIKQFLMGLGIEEKDITTTNVYSGPWYEEQPALGVPCDRFGYCPPYSSEIVGQQVSQSATVKVRDREKVGEILSGVGSRGAMNVSGPSFTIDDPKAYKLEARTAAIDDAKTQAEALAEKLDARIIRMVGFYEQDMGGGPMPYRGYGGDMMVKSEAAVAPINAEISAGEHTITSSVSITYEIRSK
jgi:uncharacterized protein